MALETIARAHREPPDTTSGDEHGVCSRPVDLVHLARYTLGNKAFEREILDLFVSQSWVTLDKLKIAATEKEWRDQAHALLGSARAVGAKKVADRVLIAQKLPGSFADPLRAGVLTAIAAELEIANRYIRDLFPDE
jgi:HPt (histidine-containing phosphotransfer) domain-containing protein